MAAYPAAGDDGCCWSAATGPSASLADRMRKDQINRLVGRSPAKMSGAGILCPADRTYRVGGVNSAPRLTTVPGSECGKPSDGCCV